ncbi:MAG: zinc-binding dehydrogenase, partial [Bacteroidetes bacterium]|nr:zinc-binding dehydrogenase [Bacteroidota bacterium]
GLTAMLSVFALEKAEVRPGNGSIVVTGATGGVGSFAIMLLSRAGYRVVASTGKQDAIHYLESLGATQIIGRQDLEAGARKPLDSQRWTGAVDSVGGPTLEAIISQMQRHGSEAVCGLAGSHKLHTTVFPLILRGVNILGIDSNTCPVEVRRQAWERLSETIPAEDLERISTTISLEDLPVRADEMLAGRIRGRTVVELGTPVAGDLNRRE